MKHTLSIIILLCSFSIFSLNGKGTPQTMQEAQKHYERKEYLSAIECYRHMLTLEPNRDNATLLYNLGNAYYRQGELGQAILHYERALRIAPRDAYIRHSLMVANSQIATPIEIPTSYWHDLRQSLYQAIPLWFLVTLSYLFGALFMAGSLFFPLGSRRIYRQAGFYSSLVALPLLIALHGLLFAAQKQYKSTAEAIVMVGSATVKSSPQANSTSLYTLREGNKVIMEDASPDQQWVATTLPNGKLGWVERSSLQAIYPFTH